MQGVEPRRQVKEISMAFSDGTRKEVSNGTIHKGMGTCSNMGVGLLVDPLFYVCRFHERDLLNKIITMCFFMFISV